MPFSANAPAYSGRPSFVSQSAISCIAAHAGLNSPLGPAGWAILPDRSSRAKSTRSALRCNRCAVTAALRRNRRSRDGVTLRSERSAVAGRRVRPADASPDLVPLELEADLVTCPPIDGAVTFGSAALPG